MYKISNFYTNPFKRYRTETKSVTYETDVRTDNGDTIYATIENGGDVIASAGQSRHDGDNRVLAGPKLEENK